MNINHLRQGFLKSIQMVLRLKEGGLATAGPPCGSFVFLNMGTSKRSKSRPMGGIRDYVKRANRTLSLCGLCFGLVSKRIDYSRRLNPSIIPGFDTSDHSIRFNCHVQLYIPYQIIVRGHALWEGILSARQHTMFAHFGNVISGSFPVLGF